MNTLPREFYLRPTLDVAKDLLGKYLVYESSYGQLVGEINETEAYTKDDPACHAFRGKTPRNAVMFEEGGYSYVYFIYGMYFCLNVTTEEEGTPGAVLIRSVIPTEGVEVMRRLCGKSAEIPSYKLTNGPGKICKAFGITRQQNGLDLVNSKKIWVEDRGKTLPKFETTTRIGLKVAVDRPWRFYYSPVR
jgi:DNA-3-methyladenine glycosylase